MKRIEKLISQFDKDPFAFAKFLHKLGTCGKCCVCAYQIDNFQCFDANCVHGIELWLNEELDKSETISQQSVQAEQLSKSIENNRTGHLVVGELQSVSIIDKDTGKKVCEWPLHPNAVTSNTCTVEGDIATTDGKYLKDWYKRDPLQDPLGNDYAYYRDRNGQIVVENIKVPKELDTLLESAQQEIEKLQGKK